jgi:hypothetical protein
MSWRYEPFFQLVGDTKKTFEHSHRSIESAPIAACLPWHIRAGSEAIAHPKRAPGD